MPPHALPPIELAPAELAPADLASVTGAGAGRHASATWLDGIRDTLGGVYQQAVSLPTAAVGGWQLAGQMYGDRVTFSDRLRAIGAVHDYLAASTTLPAWARR